MAWDPDAAAAQVPVAQTQGSGDSSWDPDSHIDRALENVQVTAKRIGPAEDSGLGSFEELSNPWPMMKQVGKQLLGGALDSARTITGAENPTQAQSNETSLGLGPSTDPSLQSVRKIGGFMAPSPAPQGNPLLSATPQFAENVAGRTLGQVTGSPAIQSVESTIGRLPGGAPIRSSITAQKTDLANKVQDVVDNLAGGSSTTAYSVGTKLDSAITQGAKDLKDVGGQAYDAIDTAMPKDANVTPTVTQKVLQTMTQLPKGAENLSKQVVDPTLGAISAALKKDLDANAGFIPYDALKAVMQQLNNKIDWTGFSGNANNGALKQVYLAMRQDLNATADTYGQGQAVKTANKNWGDVKDRLDTLNNAVSGNGGPEQIFNRLVNGAKLGPSGLSNVMDVLSDSNQRLLAAGVLQRMGKSVADSSEFDADTFFRNWGKIDPDAKKRLFGSLPQQYAKNLDTLVQNAKDLKAYATVLPNASNTAQASVWAVSATEAINNLLQGKLIKAGIAAVGGPAATNLIAKALTNPRIVRYLAQETQPSKVLQLGARVPPVVAGALSQKSPPPRQVQSQSPAPWLDQ